MSFISINFWDSPLTFTFLSIKNVVNPTKKKLYLNPIQIFLSFINKYHNQPEYLTICGTLSSSSADLFIDKFKNSFISNKIYKMKYCFRCADYCHVMIKGNENETNEVLDFFIINRFLN